MHFYKIIKTLYVQYMNSAYYVYITCFIQITSQYN